MQFIVIESRGIHKIVHRCPATRQGRGRGKGKGHALEGIVGLRRSRIYSRLLLGAPRGVVPERPERSRSAMGPNGDGWSPSSIVGAVAPPSAGGRTHVGAECRTPYNTLVGGRNSIGLVRSAHWLLLFTLATTLLFSFLHRVHWLRDCESA